MSAECSPLCGAQNAYGRFVKPWQHDFRCPAYEKKVCGFCKGKPVGNAATWLDDKPRLPAPCPRCGETNLRVCPACGNEQWREPHNCTDGPVPA